LLSNNRHNPAFTQFTVSRIRKGPHARAFFIDKYVTIYRVDRLWFLTTWFKVWLLNRKLL